MANEQGTGGSGKKSTWKPWSNVFKRGVPSVKSAPKPPITYYNNPKQGSKTTSKTAPKPNSGGSVDRWAQTWKKPKTTYNMDASEWLRQVRNAGRGEDRDMGILGSAGQRGRFVNQQPYANMAANYGSQQPTEETYYDGGGDYYGGGYEGGGGGGEPAPAPEVTWSDKYALEGAPSWWKGMMPSELTPDTEFAVILNTLIPYLSTEDQRQMATSLSSLFPKAFSNYSPEATGFGQPASAVTDLTKQYMLSQERATSILGAMNKMKEASGKSDTDFGPGYSYVRNLAQTMKDFGAQGGNLTPTRRQLLNMYSALDPMLAEASGERLGAYGEAARALTQPFFGAGKLVNVNKDQEGNWTFGSANKSWF